MWISQANELCVLCDLSELINVFDSDKFKFDDDLNVPLFVSVVVQKENNKKKYERESIV